MWSPSNQTPRLLTAPTSVGTKRTLFSLKASSKMELAHEILLLASFISPSLRREVAGISENTSSAIPFPNTWRLSSFLLSLQPTKKIAAKRDGIRKEATLGKER